MSQFSYLFHDLDGLHSVLGWGIQQHTVIEWLEHRFHGFYWPHQSNQFRCNVIYGPSNRATEGGCCGGATWPSAMISDPWGGWIGLETDATVGRGDCFVMDWISQDYYKGWAQLLPGEREKGTGGNRKKISQKQLYNSLQPFSTPTPQLSCISGAVLHAGFVVFSGTTWQRKPGTYRLCKGVLKSITLYSQTKPACKTLSASSPLWVLVSLLGFGQSSHGLISHRNSC